MHMPYLTTIVYRSMTWYKRAADDGDIRAMQRLKGVASKRHGDPGDVLNREDSDGAKSNGKDCIIM